MYSFYWTYVEVFLTHSWMTTIKQLQRSTTWWVKWKWLVLQTRLQHPGEASMPLSAHVLGVLVNLIYARYTLCVMTKFCSNLVYSWTAPMHHFLFKWCTILIWRERKSSPKISFKPFNDSKTAQEPKALWSVSRWGTAHPYNLPGAKWSCISFCLTHVNLLVWKHHVKCCMWCGKKCDLDTVPLVIFAIF